MSKPIKLYSKLALTITAFGLVVAIGFLVLFSWSSERYHQEVTQQLHKELAQYVLEHLPGPLYIETEQGDRINEQVLKATAINTMEINPSVEVYLLDGQGRILAHALPKSSVQTHDIDVTAIHRFLDSETEGPVLGQNPRQLSQHTIFSAAPVWFNQDMKGYLYVVLASFQAKSISEQLSGSHITRLTLGAVAAAIIFLGVSAYFSFRRITLPIGRLANSVKAYRTSTLVDNHDFTHELDEVGELKHAFELMQQRIQSQFDQINETDRIRRELVSNISHDLRTPLASMQGYLETILIQENNLSEEKKRQYIHIAHRHGKHLNELIAQLFELSKLDAGKVEPAHEVFSITELLFDVKQDYELIAEKEGIELKVETPNENTLVLADISLIQRVLQNLLDNAIKHTPEQGRILLKLSLKEGQVFVAVHDSGTGISQKDIPHVFDRFYQAESLNASSGSGSGSSSIGAGLGLSIVKKILDLHGALIDVVSEPSSGTCFEFRLPVPLQAAA